MSNKRAILPSKLEPKRQRTSSSKPKKRITSKQLYNRARFLPGNHIVSRQLQETCHALASFDKNTALSKRGVRLAANQRAHCYMCGKDFRSSHPVYIFCCLACGNVSQKFRHFTRNLDGHVALVTGGRTKLGHQIALKLLRAKCKVIITTRHPKTALELYKQYEDYGAWSDRLHVFPQPFDLDSEMLRTLADSLARWIEEKFAVLDVLVNCAAQTIRCREKATPPATHVASDGETNRYGDAKHVDKTLENSWSMLLPDTPQHEMEEAFRVNAVAPFMLIGSLHPLMQKSTKVPYIINVHAREGRIDCGKSRFHVHLNMVKSAMHMMTRCLPSYKWTTHAGRRFSTHGCDPGWISVDEYYETDKPFPVAPLDEIDGAARVLYPLFRQADSCRVTRRHFFRLEK